MDINYPPRLQLMFDSQSSSSISFNLNFGLPKNAVEKFPKYPLPGRFARYEGTSSFILNYWKGLVTLSLLLFIIAMATIFAPLTKSTKYVHLILRHIENITKWDLFLLLLCTNIDGLGVYSSLELRNIHPNVALSLLSTIICFAMNLLVLNLLAQALYMFIDLQRSRYQVIPLPQVSPINNEDNLKKKEAPKWSQYSILYRDFKDTSFFQQSFMFFFLLRVYAFDMIIGYFFAYPLAQAIVINIMSIVLISYLAFKRPYKRPFDLVKLMINESIIALVNMNVLILAVLDKCGAELTGIRARLGDIVIIANVMFNVLAVFFIVAEVILRVVTVYKIMKKSKAKGRAFWMKAFLSLFEQDGLELKSKNKVHGEETEHRLKMRKTTTRHQFIPQQSFSSAVESASASIMIPKDADSDIEPLPKFKGFNVKSHGKLEGLNQHKGNIQKERISSINLLSPTTYSSSPKATQSGTTQHSERAQQPNHSSHEMKRSRMSIHSNFGTDTMVSISEKQRSSVIDLKGLISENYRGLLEESEENNRVRRNLARSGEGGGRKSLSIVYRKNQIKKNFKGNYAGTIYDDV